MESVVHHQRAWADAPWDILMPIMGRLFGKDIAAFRQVCSHWSRTPTPQDKHIDAPISDIVRHPFLLRFRFNDDLSSYCQLYSPAYNKTYLIDAVEGLGDVQIHCSNYGWLLLSRNTSRNTHYFFLHPTTKSIIDLPNLGSSDITSYNRMSFSAPPTSPHCVVMGLVDMFENYLFICFIRRGENSWTRPYGVAGFQNKIQSTSFRKSSTDSSTENKIFKWTSSSSAPIFRNGCFYCLGLNGVLGVFNPDREEDSMWRLLNTEHSAFMFDICCEAYMMESTEGELISVVTGSTGKPLRVVKFNDKRKRWQTISCLKDQVIFLSRPSCLVMRSEELQVKGFGNTIHLPSFHRNYNVFYSLSSRRFHTFEGGYTSEDLCDTNHPLNCTWMEPNFQSFHDQQLNWLLDPVEPINEGNDAFHLLHDLTFLPPNDSSKCKSLSSGIKRIMGREALDGKPWIIMDHESEGKELHIVVDISNGISHSSEFTGVKLGGAQAFGIRDGTIFLMNEKTHDCVLLNTATMVVDPLPTWKIQNYRHGCCLLHTSPHDSKLMIIMFGSIMFGSIGKVNPEDRYKHVAIFCQVGDDEWTTAVSEDLNVKGAVTYKGRIYGISKFSKFVEIEIQPKFIIRPFENIEVPYYPRRGCLDVKCRFVESCGELLFFYLLFVGHRVNVTKHIIAYIKVYRLDVETISLEGVENLGDRAFFFDDWSSGFGCCASNLGLKKNSIYFISEHDNKLYRYDYGDDSVSFSVYCPDMEQGWHKNKFVMYN